MLQCGQNLRQPVSLDVLTESQRRGGPIIRTVKLAKPLGQKLLSLALRWDFGNWAQDFGTPYTRNRSVGSNHLFAISANPHLFSLTSFKDGTALISSSSHSSSGNDPLSRFCVGLQ